ncbi:MAG TPA: LuxR C-terminal-related transcriptional regulator [Ramlibacter sp.]|nr:LuxR C-terminal-related transcriptional regulator [Ramlibacter sp.]
MPDVGIQVHLVAPALLCWGLDRLLRSGFPEIVLAGSSNTLAEAAETLKRQLVDVVIFDYDDVEGVDTVQQFHEQTGAPTIAIVGHGNAHQVSRLAGLGVRCIIDSHSSPSELLRQVVAVGQAAQAGVSGAEPRNSEPDLTDRERDILEAVVNYPNVPVKLLAERLQMSEHTLRNHLSHIYSKLSVSNRTHLYEYATAASLRRRNTTRH